MAETNKQWAVTRERGQWVTEYLVELGAMLAVDPELKNFAAMNWSGYYEGVSQLAAVYYLASPEQRLALERAIVLAGRYGQKSELIQFAATVLGEEEQAFFRSHLEDALADPGLGGLLDAMARANPDTRESAELLWGPLPYMDERSWKTSLYGYIWTPGGGRDWVAQALYDVAMDRWKNTRKQVRPPHAVDRLNYTPPA